MAMQVAEQSPWRSDLVVFCSTRQTRSEIIEWLNGRGVHNANGTLRCLLEEGVLEQVYDVEKVGRQTCFRRAWHMLPSHRETYARALFAALAKEGPWGTKMLHKWAFNLGLSEYDGRRLTETLEQSGRVSVSSSGQITVVKDSRPSPKLKTNTDLTKLAATSQWAPPTRANVAFGAPAPKGRRFILEDDIDESDSEPEEEDGYVAPEPFSANDAYTRSLVGIYSPPDAQQDNREAAERVRQAFATLSELLTPSQLIRASDYLRTSARRVAITGAADKKALLSTDDMRKAVSLAWGGSDVPGSLILRIVKWAIRNDLKAFSIHQVCQAFPGHSRKNVQSRLDIAVRNSKLECLENGLYALPKDRTSASGI